MNYCRFHQNSALWDLHLVDGSLNVILPPTSHQDVSITVGSPTKPFQKFDNLAPVRLIRTFIQYIDDNVGVA